MAANIKSRAVYEIMSLVTATNSSISRRVLDTWMRLFSFLTDSFSPPNPANAVNQSHVVAGLSHGARLWKAESKLSLPCLVLFIRFLTALGTTAATNTLQSLVAIVTAAGMSISSRAVESAFKGLARGGERDAGRDAVKRKICACTVWMLKLRVTCCLFGQLMLRCLETLNKKQSVYPRLFLAGSSCQRFISISRLHNVGRYHISYVWAMGCCTDRPVLQGVISACGLTRTGLTAARSALPTNPFQQNRQSKRTRRWWKAPNEYASLQHNAGLKRKQKRPKTRGLMQMTTRACFHTHRRLIVVPERSKKKNYECPLPHFISKCNLHFIFRSTFSQACVKVSWIAASEASRRMITHVCRVMCCMKNLSAGSYSSIPQQWEKGWGGSVFSVI